MFHFTTMNYFNTKCKLKIYMLNKNMDIFGKFNFRIEILISKMSIKIMVNNYYFYPNSSKIYHLFIAFYCKNNHNLNKIKQS